MLGGIIGDLVATTWKNDKSTFYKQLISPAVRLSEYGDLALKLMRNLALNEPFDFVQFMRAQGPITYHNDPITLFPNEGYSY